MEDKENGPQERAKTEFREFVEVVSFIIIYLFYSLKHALRKYINYES